MSNSASPTRAQIFAQIKAWLAANGIVSTRIGFFQPGDEGAVSCQFPLAAIWPEPITPNPTHGGFDEEERVKVFVWFTSDGDNPYSDTMGGWFSNNASDYTPFRFHDDITSGPFSAALWFKHFGSGQFIVTIDGYEEYAWTPLSAGGPLGVELTLKINVSAGPAEDPATIDLSSD